MNIRFKNTQGRAHDKISASFNLWRHVNTDEGLYLRIFEFSK